MVPKICSVPDCETETLARGWCRKHYLRWQRHGDPLAGKTTYTDTASRFWAKVNKDGPTPKHDPQMGPCWLWAAAKNARGYGQFKHGGTMRSAHRISYLLTHGSEPDGLDMDHLCRNRACVRPSHFRLTTRKQNSEHLDLQTTNTSGYRGVSFNRASNKWQVKVGHNRRHYYGGLYEDVHVAGEVAKSMRNRLHTHNDLDRKAS